MVCLPQELWDICIDELSTERPSQLSFSLVCKSWCYRARRHIFSHVDLYVMHSLQRTSSFLKILRNKNPPCTFLHSVCSLSFEYFDDPFVQTSVRQLNTFFTRLVKDLARLPNLQRTNFRRAFWSGCRLQVSDYGSFPRMNALHVDKVIIEDLYEYSQTISQFCSLEELTLNAMLPPQTSDHQPLPLPATLRRISLKTRLPSPGEYSLYGWLADSRLENLVHICVNPTQTGLLQLGRVMKTCRNTLRKVVMQPEFNEHVGAGDRDVYEGRSSNSNFLMPEAVIDYARGEKSYFCRLFAFE